MLSTEQARRIGKIGAKATMKKYGKKHYALMGRLSAQKRAWKKREQAELIHRKAIVESEQA